MGWCKINENHPDSIAEFISDLQRVKAAAATSSSAATPVNAAVHTIPITSLRKNDP
jgi:hypothetical protein